MNYNLNSVFLGENIWILTYIQLNVIQLVLISDMSA